MIIMVKKAIVGEGMTTITAVILLAIMMFVITYILIKFGPSLISVGSGLKDYFVCISGEGGSKALACINILKSAFSG